tara:strand:+ start:860 stop:1141 length:282 start_codon:yes stop_codon:yes gene_type:complete
MILKIFGALDIIAALSIWFGHFFNIIPQSFITLIAFYLLAKGIFFLISADIASILDVISAIIIFISFSVNMPGFIIIIVSLFLIQKGIFSWLA